jgi:hypothetical protein
VTPGFHPEISAREYFAECCPAPALTCSTLKALLYRTAAEAAYEHPGISPDSEAVQSTAEKRFGNVAHELALGKGQGYVVGDYDAWQSKEAKAFKADAEISGLVPIKRKDYERATFAASVMKGEIERTLAFLNGGECPDYQTEVVFTWKEGPVWCRGMMDVWCPSLGVILDPKFSPVIGAGFEAHAVKMAWDLQANWYPRGVAKIAPSLAGRVRFINLIVHPRAPFVSRAREADEATTSTLTPLIERQIDRFARCLQANDWAGYPRVIEPWTARSYTMAERMMMNIGEDE